VPVSDAYCAELGGVKYKHVHTIHTRTLFKSCGIGREYFREDVVRDVAGEEEDVDDSALADPVRVLLRSREHQPVRLA
jgi:hypothetical protein